MLYHYKQMSFIFKILTIFSLAAFMVLPKCPCQVAAAFGVDLDGRGPEVIEVTHHVLHDQLPFRNDECHCLEECNLVSDCSQENGSEVPSHHVDPVELTYGAELLSDLAWVTSLCRDGEDVSLLCSMPPPRCRYCVYRL